MTKYSDYKILERRTDLGLLILRLSIGGLMLLHGIFKLQYGIDFIAGMVSQAGLPQFIAYGVYIGEVVAPILIIAGIATRLAAASFAINCVVAALLAHVGDLLTINEVGGWAVELLGLYFFGALALVCTGGGKYSISNKYIWD